MTAARPILRVGLTGGIASGKTTVAGILAAFGAFVIDADELAHRLLEPDGAAYGPVIERFGREILDEEQRIVRPRLAAQVFHDGEAREALNAIVHPRVMEEAERRVTDYAPAGGAPITVFDAALLVETGLWRQFHKLIVVHCSRETQIRRLLARDGLETDEAEARIDSQAPLADKLAVADYEVETEGTFRETRASVGTIYASLLNDFERETGGPTD